MMQKRTYMLQKVIRRQLAQAASEDAKPLAGREEVEDPSGRSGYLRQVDDIETASSGGDLMNSPLPSLPRTSFHEIRDGSIRVIDGARSSTEEEGEGQQPRHVDEDDDHVGEARRGDEFSPDVYELENPTSSSTSQLARAAGPSAGKGAERGHIEFDPRMIALRVRCASLLVRNALQNLDHALMDQILGSEDDNRTEAKMKRYIRAHSLGYRIFMATVILFHLLLTFLEPFSPTDSSPMPLAISIILSFMFSIVYVFDIAVKYSYMRKKEFFTMWTNVRIVLVLLNILESIILLALLIANVQVFLVSRMWRPFYLIERSSSLRLIVESSLRSAKNCVPIFFIIFCVILFFSYLGFIIFTGTVEGRMYFGTIGDSITNMFVLLTTANFPDVMMPAYSSNRWWAVFFISYLIVVLFFLIHLVTATFYNSFTELATEDILAQLEIRRDSLEMAFHLMDYDDTSSLSCMQWSELYTQLHPKAKEEHIQLTFRMVDKDGSNSIDIDEFLQICDFIDLRFYSKKRRQSSASSSETPLVSFRKRLYAFLRHKITILCRQAFILGNCIFLIIDTAGCSAGPDLEETWDCPSLDFVALGATVIYLIEQALLIYAYGRRFATACRVIDLVLCIIMFTAQVVAIVINQLTPDQSRLLLLPRIFVILRLFVNFARTRRITKALLRMVTPILRYMIVLVCWYYTYAIIGVEIFQGYINPQDPDPRLIGTLFDTSNFWANNFNSLGSAWVVLYELMIVNNFFVTMEGYVTVTNRWARLYFIIFICAAVYIFLNLFIGFIIQAFLRSYEGIEFRKTFRANLQAKVDAASTVCGLDQTNRVWYAEFKPNLLDYYLDVFHLEHTIKPSSEDDKDKEKEDEEDAKEDATAVSDESREP